MEKTTVAMETLVEEVADRINREVDEVNSQAAVKIQRLVEEIEVTMNTNINILASNT